ncbi:MAG: nitrogen fixation protein NifZ [Aquabacterium sp.]|jgi:nitrogen fixation protein NifZ|nr:MAG: nitrogen fixation protein NifZ [Aquabacterium sp.]TAL21571.1 MAG: nitrogen fixation protein NifZ [Aquabacterium sp.]
MSLIPAAALPAVPREPEYPWGLHVIALDDLFNDGSYPERDPDACLAEAGAIGEIVNVGQHVDSGEPIYLVQFGDCVIGCVEDEIAPAPRGLRPAGEAG